MKRNKVCIFYNRQCDKSYSELNWYFPNKNNFVPGHKSAHGYESREQCLKLVKQTQGEYVSKGISDSMSSKGKLLGISLSWGDKNFGRSGIW